MYCNVHICNHIPLISTHILLMFSSCGMLGPMLFFLVKFHYFLTKKLGKFCFYSVNFTNFFIFWGLNFTKILIWKKWKKKHLLGWMTRVLELLFWTWNGNIANNLGKTIVGVHIFGNLENINCQKTIQKKTCWNKGSCERKIKNTKLNKSFMSIILTITRWLRPLLSSHAMWGRGRVRRHICKEMNMEAMGQNKACEWEDQEKAKKRNMLNFLSFIFFYKQIGKYLRGKKILM